jgi:thioesterase domain-containing protein
MAMTSDNNPDTSVKVEIIPQNTNEMVDQEMAGETDEVRRETKSLIDALKKRAQAEAQSAGTLTRQTYLDAVRQARAKLEQDDPLIARDRIEQSFELIQKEAEKNWQAIVNEVAELGDRLADAAKAAWEALTAPRPRS